MAVGCGSGKEVTAGVPHDTTTTPDTTTLPSTPDPNSASQAPALKTATTHPIQYYISVPRGWPGNRTWPAVVTITGSGRDWLPNAQAFAAERDARNYPFIIITPIVVTMTESISRTDTHYNYPSSAWDLAEQVGVCRFDQDGLAAIANDMYLRFGASQRKYFLTGFSGGGHVTLGTLFLHPEALRGVGPAAVNYNGRCVTKETPPLPVSTAPERVQLPVRFFNGSADPFTFLLAQRDTAITLARQNGYNNITSTIVEGAGHAPHVPQTLAYFYSLLPASER